MARGQATACPLGRQPRSGQLGAGATGAAVKAAILELLGANTARVDLALALSLMGSRTLLASGIDPQGDAPVPATFTLARGRLAEVAVRLDEIPGAPATAQQLVRADPDDFESAMASCGKR